jgi:hypothetical protein
MKDANEAMKMIIRTAKRIAEERQDFGIDPKLPLLRKEHPEWFEDIKPN